MNKEIVKTNDYVAQAIEQKVTVENLEKILAFMKGVKAEQAKEAFVQAMSVFQDSCPVIKKTKKVLNKDGRTVRYQYAPLDSIVEQIKKPLKEAGVSYRWETKNANGEITAICTVTHILGHSESSEFAVPIDKEGFMTAPQKYASALTFAKRYSLCNALGISTGDEDTDATDVGKEKTAKSDKSKIIFLLKTLGKKAGTKEDVIDGVKDLAQLDLTKENFSEIVGRLEVLVKEKNEDTTVQQ